uniref:S-protein homolog n=1 Tax=Panagrolaimus sp. ES5 TaxID=591445 RepID=A0AC34GNH7_9BILA
MKLQFFVLFLIFGIVAAGLDDVVDLGLKIAQLAEKHDEKYVRIVNHLGPDVKATVECASGDDKIETKEISDQESFAWKFKPHFGGKTLFYCDVKSSDGKNQHWDVYKGKERSQDWYLRGGGIYQGDQNGNGLLKKHDWKN